MPFTARWEYVCEIGFEHLQQISGLIVFGILSGLIATLLYSDLIATLLYSARGLYIGSPRCCVGGFILSYPHHRGSVTPHDNAGGLNNASILYQGYFMLTASIRLMCSSPSR